MELAIRRRQPNKLILIPFLIISMVCLIPAAIVFANAFTDPTIGMSGVNNSDLTAGFNGSGDILIDFDNPGHINPSSMSYGLMIIVPLIFLLLAIILVLSMVFGDGLDLRKLILVAVLIITALALLAGVNFSTNSLLGG